MQNKRYEYMLDYKELNQQLDLVDFWQTNNIKHSKVSNDEWVAKCPAHSDRTPSFAFNTTKKCGHCFSCGFKSDGIGFVRQYFGFDSMFEAVKTLELFVSDYVSVDKGLNSALDNLKQAKKLKNKVNKWRGQLPEKNLWNTDMCMNIRELSAKTIELFGLIADADQSRIAIPITCSGSLVGIQWYNTQKDDDGKFYYKDSKGKVKYVKKYHIEHGFNKSKFLFGLDQAKDAIIDTDAVVLVEGAFCTMAAHDHGVPNTVCSFGATLSEEQAKQITDLASTVYMCYDNDSAGRKGAYEAMLELGPTIEVKLCALPRGKDVYDLTAEEFKEVLEKAV